MKKKLGDEGTSRHKCDTKSTQTDRQTDRYTIQIKPDLVHVSGLCKSCLHFMSIRTDYFESEIINKILEKMEHPMSQTIRLALKGRK